MMAYYTGSGCTLMLQGADNEEDDDIIVAVF